MQHINQENSKNDQTKNQGTSGKYNSKNQGNTWKLETSGERRIKTSGPAGNKERTKNM